MYDLIIIGEGAAGLTAGIYAARAKLNAIVLEKNYLGGGQINNTYEVDNYPGLPGISGMKLAEAMRNHAEKVGVQFKVATVSQIEDKGDSKLVHTSEGILETRCVLVATGATHSKLGIPGEQELGGRGVSYCATCDGGFYRNKEVAVIGGGNVAVEDAIYLARLCKKVYLVHRRDELRAEKVLQESLATLSNVEMVLNSVATNIIAQDGKVHSLAVQNKLSGETQTLTVQGVFIAVGIVPESSLLSSLVDCDEKGYVRAGEDGRASRPGFFVAGDIRTKEVRQIATAVGDGAAVVHSIQQYLNTNQWK